MKARFLQFGKAISAALFVLLLNVAGMTNAFADDQIAVLQHEGTITTFYGANAFVEAQNAAETGDMITLSAGNFNACNIYKSITIHGAGVRQDTTVDNRTGTYFLGDFRVETAGSDEIHLIVEGVYFTGIVYYQRMYYAEFYRCIFAGINRASGSTSTDYNMSNCKFYNCRIGTLSLSNSDHVSSVNVCLFNSLVFNTNYLRKDQSTEKNIIAYNSYVAYGAENPKCSDFFNCIVSGRSGYVPQESCTLYNCVMAKNGYEGSLLENAFHRGCIEVDTVSQIFENYTGEFYDEQFILNDEISSSIQGTDGTEVGIYGGMYPFYDIPKYMIMRRCTVGSRTTDDGHLSVDIEVVTEQ